MVSRVRKFVLICLSPENPAPPRRSNNGDGTNNAVVLSDNWQDSQQTGGLERFSFDEMSSATEGFLGSRILGVGGFGKVYRAFIDETVKAGSAFREVAVKVRRANTEFQDRTDRMMLREMDCQGQLRHDNIARVTGFCWENTDRMLVYEYMPNRSLDRHIYSNASDALTWLQRMRVALGAAKGLDFIHTAEPQLVYRDFKTANILLDQHWNAKLSDFGTAREGPTGDQSHVKTVAMGTDGYIDRHYRWTDRVSSKSDVYSFGVVLLEMLAGRNVIDTTRPRKKEYNLVKWGRSKLKQDKKLLKLVDSRIKSDTQDLPPAAMEVANICHECLRRWPGKRPHMSQVVQMLETVVQTIAIAEAPTEAVTGEDEAEPPSQAGTNQGEAEPSQAGTNQGEAEPSQAGTNQGEAEPSQAGTDQGEAEPSQAGTDQGEAEPSQAGTNQGEAEPSQAGTNQSEAEPSQDGTNQGEVGAAETSEMLRDKSDLKANDL